MTSDYSPDSPATDPTGRVVRPAATAGLMLSGRYRLEALLASTGGIMTWRATDNVLSRPVLMHLLPPDDERMGWVLNAARKAATITDARFLRVLDALEATGQEPWSFVVSEFAVGDSLQTLLGNGPVSGEQASYIVGQMASALAPLHARGMFHLRISPSSVIITVNGNIKIVGFLIDAALRPKPGEDQLSWAEQEAIDCYDLGRLLYSLTTATWPVPPDEPQRAHWGLPAAPLRLSRSSGQGAEQLWASPHDVNSSIAPSVSTVTMAALRPKLGLVGPGLHSANDIADSLDGLADLVDAGESLETLMRHNHQMPTPPPAPVQTEWVSMRADPAETTQRMASLDVNLPDPIDESEAPTEVVKAQEWRPAADDDWRPTLAQPAVNEPPVTAPPSVETHPRPAPAPPRLKSKKVPSATLGRRVIVLLIGFVVVALLVLQIRGCATGGSGGDETTSGQPTAIAPVAIASVFDFDPAADGGDNNENSSQAPYAADGDTSTVWHTLTYLNNPAFGGLKPGAGIVYDLGSAVPVASVRLLLDNEPTAVQLMVPIENDATAASPPMNTVNEWQVIASDPAGGSETTLSPDEPVTTRWLMVYFTSLPPIGGNQYRSGIVETYINQ